MDTKNPGNEHNIRDLQHIDLITAEWQIVADLSFCDLVLWIPNQGTYTAYAQARPVTAQTTLPQDITGSPAAEYIRQLLNGVHDVGTAVTSETEYYAGPAGVAAWPVRKNNKIIALLTVHQNLVSQRHASRLEEIYRQSAQDLLAMIGNGKWPAQDSKASSTSHGNPRVGDGLVRIDSHGLVVYASPNAVSAFRKLGIREAVDGRQLSRMVTHQLDRSIPIDEILPNVLFGRESTRVDIENRNIVLSARSIPLINTQGIRFAALVLLRDITEIRHRDEQLISKDATIREIHHRVKNNLQTVGSLLRMQARRMTSDGAKQALLQAMSRVDAIALVHETLSHTTDATVDMDDLLRKQFRMAVEIAVESRNIQTDIRGNFGYLPGHLATPIALVINELATNAVEHGTGADGGTISLKVRRIHSPGQKHPYLKIEMTDQGTGKTGNSLQEIGSGLGTKIVRTLVESDLRGSITWQQQRSQHTGHIGTTAVLKIPLDH